MLKLLDYITVWISPPRLGTVLFSKISHIPFTPRSSRLVSFDIVRGKSANISVGSNKKSCGVECQQVSEQHCAFAEASGCRD